MQLTTDPIGTRKTDGMSGTFSPSRFNGDVGGYLHEGSPPEDISIRMRVPKRIKANGEAVDDELSNGGPNGLTSWELREKFDMNVPDRIMLLGQDQHIGTRAPPREIVLENSVLGSTLTLNEVRVNTPPRVITLEQHCFPSAAEPLSPSSPTATPPSPVENRKMPPMLGTTPPRRAIGVLNDSRLFREATPPVEGLTAGEEIVHLRRQVARINRRVMAIEMDALQRQQRERLAYAFGIAYILYKVIAWLNRS